MHTNMHIWNISVILAQEAKISVHVFSSNTKHCFCHSAIYFKGKDNLLMNHNCVALSILKKTKSPFAANCPSSFTAMTSSVGLPSPRLLSAAVSNSHSAGPGCYFSKSFQSRFYSFCHASQQTLRKSSLYTSSLVSFLTRNFSIFINFQ